MVTWIVRILGTLFVILSLSLIGTVMLVPIGMFISIIKSGILFILQLNQ
jgi:hypothetical protein